MLFVHRFHRLVTHISPVHDEAGITSLVTQLVAPVTAPEVVAFANAHAFNLACRDTCFYHHLLDADVLLRDGVGVKGLFTLMGKPPGLNMNGTDLLPTVVQAGIDEGRTIALIGATPTVAAEAEKTLTAQGAQVSFAVDGYRDIEDYLALLDQHQPALCLLAMGMPRQEALAQHIKVLQRHQVRVFCGGAILDFYTQGVRRAPPWMRRHGCEWLYRLLQEPRRLFGRYVVGNPLFLMRALVTRLWIRRG